MGDHEVMCMQELVHTFVESQTVLIDVSIITKIRDGMGVQGKPTGKDVGDVSTTTETKSQGYDTVTRLVPVP